MLFRLFALAAFSFIACAGPQTIKQPQAESWDLDFQAKPLSTKTVRTKIAGQSAALGACFQRERLSSDVLATFVFELIIPNDGTSHEVILVSTSQPKQEILSECVHLQLKKLKFAPHAGPSLRLKVPIQAQPLGS